MHITAVSERVGRYIIAYHAVSERVDRYITAYHAVSERVGISQRMMQCQRGYVYHRVSCSAREGM